MIYVIGIIIIICSFFLIFSQGLSSTTSAGTVSEVDIVCGQLLQHSTYRCPNLGKTWFAYADWCYKWGRKIIEQEK